VPDIKHFDPDQVLDTVVGLFWERGADTTGVSEVVKATGLSRSSLYATYGGKKDLHAAALLRYVEQQSGPVFDRLASDERGLPAIADFFTGLIEARCSGEHARWGCMVSNAHASGDRDDPQVRRVLDLHHGRLRAAMLSALTKARDQGQLRQGVELESTAELLTLIAYGVNLRSRAGADPADLNNTVTVALTTMEKHSND
jgi:TetR/AcrR family transcriptional repressor of nem operon